MKTFINKMRQIKQVRVFVWLLAEALIAGLIGYCSYLATENPAVGQIITIVLIPYLENLGKRINKNLGDLGVNQDK